MKRLFLLSLFVFLGLSFGGYGQSTWRNPSSTISEGSTDVQIGATYGRNEIIYGNVKELIQIRHKIPTVRNVGIRLDADTTCFDRKGNITKGNLSLDTLHHPFYTYKYFDKYASNPQIIKVEFDTTRFGIVHVFDKNTGEDIGTELVSTNEDDRFYLSQYKELSFGKIFEFKFYKAKNVVGLKEIYKNNSKDLLSEICDYSSDGKLEEKVVITYLIFDGKGNWTKRIETRKNSKGLITGRVITNRKIIYY